MKFSPRFLGILALILSIFAARSDIIFAPPLLARYSIFFVLLIASLLSSAVCIVYLLIRKKATGFWQFWSQNSLLIWINALMAGILAPLLFLLAIQKGSPITASFFSGFTPLFVTILAYIFLKERNLHANFFAGAALMFLGMFILITKGFSKFLNFNYYNLFALLASFIYSFTHILSKKYIPMRNLDFVVTTRLLTTAFFLVLVNLFIIGLPESQIPNWTSNWYHFFAYALITIILTYVLFYYGINVVPAHEAATYILLSPLAGSLFAYLFRDEIITGSQIIGAAIIFLGMIVVNIDFRRRRDLVTVKIHGKGHHS